MLCRICSRVFIDFMDALGVCFMYISVFFNLTDSVLAHLVFWRCIQVFSYIVYGLTLTALGETVDCVPCITRVFSDIRLVCRGGVVIVWSCGYSIFLGQSACSVSCTSKVWLVRLRLYLKVVQSLF